MSFEKIQMQVISYKATTTKKLNYKIIQNVVENKILFLWQISQFGDFTPFFFFSPNEQFVEI